MRSHSYQTKKLKDSKKRRQTLPHQAIKLIWNFQQFKTNGSIKFNFGELAKLAQLV